MMGKLAYAGTDTQWLKKLDNLQIGKPVFIPTVIPEIREDSLKKIIKGIMADLFRKYPRKSPHYETLLSAVHKIVLEHCDNLINVIETKKRKIDEIEKLNNELEELKIKIKEEGKKRRIEERFKLAKELRSARKSLCNLNNKITPIEESIRGEILIRWDEWWKQWAEKLPYFDQFPPAPVGILKPTKEGIGFPVISGIYFLWEDEKIVYIGQSVNIKNRLKLTKYGGITHHAMTPKTMISFIPIDQNELTFAECFYIGIYKPKYNRGTPILKRRVQ